MPRIRKSVVITVAIAVVANLVGLNSAYAFMGIADTSDGLLAALVQNATTALATAQSTLESINKVKTFTEQTLRTTKDAYLLAKHSAELANEFIRQAGERLHGRDRANMVLLRGFASHPAMPSLVDICKFRAGAIAVYPMYRGLAKLVGMTVLATGATFQDELATLRERWDEFDFFFVHYKRADAAGEDGDFDAKEEALEELDSYIPELLEMEPAVFMVAGDHSTPASYGAHSWHPVPFLMHAKWAREDGVEGFNERACRHGVLGVVPAVDVLPLALAHAGRLTKYGA